MTKKKFNKEERLAIIRKLKNIASERTEASWDKHIAAYKPSEEYKRAKYLLEQRNNIIAELKRIDGNIFDKWAFQEIDTKLYLDSLRDKELKPLVERYDVNETNLEVEIILMDQDRPIDDLIERLLRICLCK